MSAWLCIVIGDRNELGARLDTKIQAPPGRDGVHCLLEVRSLLVLGLFQAVLALQLLLEQAVVALQGPAQLLKLAVDAVHPGQLALSCRQGVPLSLRQLCSLGKL